MFCGQLFSGLLCVDMSKISSLTIVTQQGVSQYFIGSEYNGLVLDRIYDDSIEGSEENSPYCSIYKGVTSEGELVFEAINAPIEVRYSADT